MSVFVVAAAYFVAAWVASPIITDLVSGPRTAVVSYTGIDSEWGGSGRIGWGHTIYHLRFRAVDGELITIDLNRPELNRYQHYFESLHNEELTFYPQTRVVLLDHKP